MREKMLQTFDEGSKEQWDFKAYTPDLVVINLGTNDFSVEPKPFKSEFVASYTKILKQLRQHYGDVPILCIYCCTIPAPVYDYYETALVEMNDKNIHLLQMKKDLFNTEARCRMASQLQRPAQDGHGNHPDGIDNHRLGTVGESSRMTNY